jgi:hypothetical protein
MVCYGGRVPRNATISQYEVRRKIFQCKEEKVERGKRGNKTKSHDAGFELLEE